MVQNWKTNFWNYDAKLENYFWNNGANVENYIYKETENYYENQNQKC